VSVKLFPKSTNYTKYYKFSKDVTQFINKPPKNIPKTQSIRNSIPKWFYYKRFRFTRMEAVIGSCESLLLPKTREGNFVSSVTFYVVQNRLKKKEANDTCKAKYC
jgi:hypothetical protein